MLAHAEEAADAEDDVLDLSRLVQDDIIDVADLFIGVVVNVDADQLGSAPFALLVDDAVLTLATIGGRRFARGRAGRAMPVPSNAAARYLDSCVLH